MNIKQLCCFIYCAHLSATLHKWNYTYNKPWKMLGSHESFPSGKDSSPDGFANEFYKMFNQPLKNIPDVFDYFKLSTFFEQLLWVLKLIL